MTLKHIKKTYLYLIPLVFICCIYLYSNESFSGTGSDKDRGKEKNTLPSILVESCNDGDTCKIRVAGLTIHVRLAEIDAPEISKKKGQDSQPFAQQAKHRLNQLVQNKYVSLEQVSLDRYNRPIVKMIELSSGDDINLKLVEEGMAELYIGGRKNEVKDPKYVQAQLQAQKQKLGIWSVTNYMSPYDYRRLNSKSSN